MGFEPTGDLSAASGFQDTPGMAQAARQRSSAARPSRRSCATVDRGRPSSRAISYWFSPWVESWKTRSRSASVQGRARTCSSLAVGHTTSASNSSRSIPGSSRRTWSAAAARACRPSSGRRAKSGSETSAGDGLRGTRCRVVRQRLSQVTGRSPRRLPSSDGAEASFASTLSNARIALCGCTSPPSA
jgi:hypothetical protein